MPFSLENFDLTDGINILRIMCGAFFIPHIYGKHFERAFTMGFFTKAGFNPPERWINIALVIEVLLAIGLILGIYTTYVAIIAAIHMAVAAAATYRVSGGRWFWNLGGYEFNTFWSLSCIVVAMNS
jgi:putative oxidoreductase